MRRCRWCVNAMSPVWFTTEKGPADTADTETLDGRVWCAIQEMLMFSDQESCEEYEEG